MITVNPVMQGGGQDTNRRSSFGHICKILELMVKKRKGGREKKD